MMYASVITTPSSIYGTAIESREGKLHVVYQKKVKRSNDYVSDMRSLFSKFPQKKPRILCAFATSSYINHAIVDGKLSSFEVRFKMTDHEIFMERPGSPEGYTHDYRVYQNLMPDGSHYIYEVGIPDEDMDNFFDYKNRAAHPASLIDYWPSPLTYVTNRGDAKSHHYVDIVEEEGKIKVYLWYDRILLATKNYDGTETPKQCIDSLLQSHMLMPDDTIDYTVFLNEDLRTGDWKEYADQSLLNHFDMVTYEDGQEIDIYDPIWFGTIGLAMRWLLRY